MIPHVKFYYQVEMSVIKFLNTGYWNMKLDFHFVVHISVFYYIYKGITQLIVKQLITVLKNTF